MTCERERVAALLRKLEKEVRGVCPDAAEVVAVYRERIEALLEEEVEAELFG